MRLRDEPDAVVPFIREIRECAEYREREGEREREMEAVLESGEEKK